MKISLIFHFDLFHLLDRVHSEMANLPLETTLQKPQSPGRCVLCLARCVSLSRLYGKKCVSGYRGKNKTKQSRYVGRLFLLVFAQRPMCHLLNCAFFFFFCPGIRSLGSSRKKDRTVTRKKD